MTNLLTTRVVEAHQGGWDESLAMLGPLLVVGALIVIARRRRPMDDEDDD